MVCFDGPVKQYLGLDAVEASEPEDLSAAQLSLGTIDLLLILSQLFPFLLPGLQAQPCLLQAWEPLCRHCGDHLEARFVALLFERQHCVLTHTDSLTVTHTDKIWLFQLPHSAGNRTEHKWQYENVSLASPQACQPTLAQCGWTQQDEELTCPQSSSPTPTKRHQSHCSTLRGAQLKGFPPNCTITICGRDTQGGISLLSDTQTQASGEEPAAHHPTAAPTSQHVLWCVTTGGGNTLSLLSLLYVQHFLYYYCN